MYAYARFYEARDYMWCMLDDVRFETAQLGIYTCFWRFSDARNAIMQMAVCSTRPPPSYALVFRLPRVYATVTAMALSVESFLLVPVGAKIDSLEGMLTRKETIQEKAALILGLILLVALCLAIR